MEVICFNMIDGVGVVEWWKLGVSVAFDGLCYLKYDFNSFKKSTNLFMLTIFIIGVFTVMFS